MYLRIVNSRPLRPARVWWNRTGGPSRNRIASAVARRIGLNTTSPTSEPTRSTRRLAARLASCPLVEDEKPGAGIVPGVDEQLRNDSSRRGALAVGLPLTPRRLLAAWLPAIAWAWLIFAFSAQPNLRFVPDASLDFLVRKAGHMAVFGVLALLAWLGVAITTSWRRPWAWALALAVLYAITDELHQGFVAGRHPSPVDVGIDAAGALIAVVLAWGILSRRRPGRA
jgi:VanZ family protein